MTDEIPIPVTCFTGFLGLGKTTTILGLLKQLPKEYKVVLVKNEYGDVEIDSLLASQSQITGVSEILNGCLCCTMVGLVENALVEIKDKYHPDRIIIESSGSAFPATLALRIRELEPKGFKLDGVVTVIDCINFKGYEDSSPSAKLQAKYTDLLLLSKHQLVSERELDQLHDHLSLLNEDTPRIKVSPENPVDPTLVFGIDTRLFSRTGDETCHCTVEHGTEDNTSHTKGDVIPVDREVLEQQLAKLNFEIYRVKGLVRWATPNSERGSIHILNWAFGRSEFTPFPDLDLKPDLEGVIIRLTIMGERGEVTRRARRFAEGLGAEMI
ncbi:hypothetical protein TREMEDRAFT_42570 [Tremella mesenterica DSM 1558]|uniref:uncharacterized protein n=1 Tax=Tremella mesenterica (strain ATCC 24925 / CBS 8224 / DSM 1558 / NBRC 9311 / NRRL Y-6157 / RJB 2259-6 / UBC 559-6) TaxID=578456 RepID=UPI0003F4A371|nr:uncharacterized protein TREMEDRAFT_42570 [Tremella mesenterica DSM 1558]EIW71089.1 hypothetical protein TREMEDRAFT_42570 [Tremella mesenterica DSM 1558]